MKGLISRLLGFASEQKLVTVPTLVSPFFMSNWFPRSYNLMDKELLEVH